MGGSVAASSSGPHIHLRWVAAPATGTPILDHDGQDRMLGPRETALAMTRLRGGSLLAFDRLTDAQFEQPALPGWTVADVFRHLAESDRGAVLGTHLRKFLPGRDLEAFEADNDRELGRLRTVDRTTLRRELEVWGRRLARAVGLVPSPAARLRVPTSFGRVPLGWLSGLRLYDEWVHQWDVAQAIGDPEPPMDLLLRDLLADFQLRALFAGPLDRTAAAGVVEVAVADGPTWRFDLASRRFGAGHVAHADGRGRHVGSAPTAHVRLDVPAFCLVAADRVGWQQLQSQGRIEVDDDAQGSGAALLSACRVV